MKKNFVATLFFIYLLFSSSTFVFAEDKEPQLFLDGKLLEFDISPIIENGSTLVPLRKLFEEYGATVTWDGTTNTVTAKYGEVILTYTIGDLKGFKGNKVIELPVAGRIVNESTFIPVRFVGEALGAMVGWENETRTITISTKSKREGSVRKVVDSNTVEILPAGEDKPTPETINLVGVGSSKLTCASYELEDKTVYFEYEPEGTDKNLIYGYLYLEDGQMLNAQMIVEGCADSSTSQSEFRWSPLFKHLQERLGGN